MEYRGPGARAWTESLAKGELIAAQAQEAGLQARLKRILIESCRRATIVIAPKCFSGNLIFQTLLLLLLLLLLYGAIV